MRASVNQYMLTIAQGSAKNKFVQENLYKEFDLVPVPNLTKVIEESFPGIQVVGRPYHFKDAESLQKDMLAQTKVTSDTRLLLYPSLTIPYQMPEEEFENIISNTMTYGRPNNHAFISLLVLMSQFDLPTPVSLIKGTHIDFSKSDSHAYHSKSDIDRKVITSFDAYLDSFPEIDGVAYRESEDTFLYPSDSKLTLVSAGEFDLAKLRDIETPHVFVDTENFGFWYVNPMTPPKPTIYFQTIC